MNAAIYHDNDDDDDDVDTAMSFILVMSWLASQQRCNERSSYHELQAMQDMHSRSHASSVWKSSTHEKVCWDETRRKERKKESKAEELILTISH